MPHVFGFAGARFFAEIVRRIGIQARTWPVRNPVITTAHGAGLSTHARHEGALHFEVTFSANDCPPHG